MPLALDGGGRDAATVGVVFAGWKSQALSAGALPPRVHARPERTEHVEGPYDRVRGYSKLGYVAPAAFGTQPP